VLVLLYRSKEVAAWTKITITIGVFHMVMMSG